MKRNQQPRVPESAYVDFIRKTFPAASDRVAVTTDIDLTTPQAIEAAVRTRLDAAVIARLPPEQFQSTVGVLAARIDIMSLLSRNPYNPASLIFLRWNPDNPADYESAYHLLYLPEDPRSAEKRLAGFGAFTCSPLRVKFNLEASDGAAIDWWIFFHELCHSLISLGILKKPAVQPFSEDKVIVSEYEAQVEEAICDAFGCLMVARHLGARAIPLLDAISDMRLSRFMQSGPSYFTSLAMQDVISQARGNGHGWLQSMTCEKIFDVAAASARANYITPGKFTASYPVYKAMKNGAGYFDLFGQVNMMAMLAYSKIFLSANEESPDKPEDDRVREAYFRSATVLSEKYMYESAIQGIGDRAVRRLRGFFSSSGPKTP